MQWRAAKRARNKAPWRRRGGQAAPSSGARQFGVILITLPRPLVAPHRRASHEARGSLGRSTACGCARRRTCRVKDREAVGEAGGLGGLVRHRGAQHERGLHEPAKQRRRLRSHRRGRGRSRLGRRLGVQGVEKVDERRRVRDAHRCGHTRPRRAGGRHLLGGRPIDCRLLRRCHLFRRQLHRHLVRRDLLCGDLLRRCRRLLHGRLPLSQPCCRRRLRRCQLSRDLLGERLLRQRHLYARLRRQRLRD
mmetsp:Transcript_679/g.1675  ORF Transcript_679/g.1675 Transcript_679/m.1675 type:complete len:249 (+) Transcript_679:539-1285(+)